MARTTSAMGTVGPEVSAGAKIEGFKILGLAGRRRAVQYRLNTDVNVFWGMNGSGKTSLLRILHSALTGDASPLIRVAFKHAEVRVRLSNGKVVTRTIEKSTSQRNEIGLFEHYLANSSDFAMSEARLVEQSLHLNWQFEASDAGRPLPHGYLPIARITERSTRPSGSKRPSMRDAPLDEANYDQAFADEINGLWQRYNTRASLRIRDVQQQALASVLDVVVNGRSFERHFTADFPDDYSRVRQFLVRQRITDYPTRGQFVARYGSDPVVESVVNLISNVMDEIDAVQQPQQVLQELLSGLLHGDKRISVSGRNLAIAVRGEEIPVTGLSSGEKQMLLILLEVMAAGDSTVIIDEPELSMHVDWQNRLLYYMRMVNPLAQIIVATHSPEVMADIRDESIFEL